MARRTALRRQPLTRREPAVAAAAAANDVGPLLRPQIAALPWRRTAAGLEVLLVTSRDSGRWVLAKGNRMRGRTDAEAAAQEALEEAGVEGAVAAEPLGAYRYDKLLKDGRKRPCAVQVYALRVRDELADWPERRQRTRRWMPPGVAAACVAEPELRALLLGLEAMLDG